MKITFKSVFFAMAFSVFSVHTANAEGPYDGIWLIKWNDLPVMYASLHEHEDNRIVIVVLDREGDGWDAYIGDRNGDQISAETIVSSLNAKISINLTSESTLDADLISCTPVEECEMPAGTHFTGKKIW